MSDTNITRPNIDRQQRLIDNAKLRRGAALNSHEALTAEVARLREALEKLENERAEQWRLRREAEADRDLEKAISLSFKLDADRYRFLRDPNAPIAEVIDKVSGEVPYDEGTKTGGYLTYEYRSGKELDLAVDAARKATEVAK